MDGHRMPGAETLVQRARALGLDGDHTPPGSRCDPADESAAAGRDDDHVGVGRVFLQLERDRPWPAITFGSSNP